MTPKKKKRKKDERLVRSHPVRHVRKKKMRPIKRGSVSLPPPLPTAPDWNAPIPPRRSPRHKKKKS